MQQLSLWTLFVEDSHVKTSQQLAKAKALSMVTGQVFGGKCTDLSITYSQELQSWKTCQPCCGKTEACTLSCKTWPKSGMMQNGALYQQDNLVHPTYVKEFLSLPTPTAANPDRTSQYKQGGYPLMHRINTMIQNQKLPTPCKSDADKMGSNTLIRLIETGQRYVKGDKRRKAAKIMGYNQKTIQTTGKIFRLNPHFVTEMMGFPIDWLD